MSAQHGAPGAGDAEGSHEIAAAQAAGSSLSSVPHGGGTTGALSIPDLTGPDGEPVDTLTAALAYARCGWYVVPVRAGTKDPGSRLGKGWQHQSSRDPQVITSWFVGTDDGIALHIGRSGAHAYDIDDPTKVPAVLAAAIDALDPPRQATRYPSTGKCHVLFGRPVGRVFGNGTGSLGSGWGDVRGANGVLVVCPSEDRYRWLRAGVLPLLPSSLADQQTDAGDTADAATDADVTAFLAAHTSGTHPGLLRAPLTRFDARVAEGASRHATAPGVACQVAREAAAGLYPAAEALAALGERFREAVTHDASTGDTRSPEQAASEWAGIVAWAVGQAGLADPAETRAKALERVSPLGPEPPEDDAGLPREEREGVDLLPKSEALSGPPEGPESADLLTNDTAPATASAAPEQQELTAVQTESPPAAPGWPSLIRSGGSFVLDLPDHIPAVWGTGEEVLWAEGESLVIAGVPGVGKSTVAGQVVRARLGLGDGLVLGLPVALTGTRVLYLAMDRPQQIARSLARQFCPADRAVLDERLAVWAGPPPGDIAQRADSLSMMAQAAGADTVVIDSVKDAAVGLTDDTVAAGYNRARQHALAAGVQVLELHHMVKRNSAGGAPTSLADVYGSAWLTAGAGSVVLLHGDPGDPVVSLRHLKQPGAEVGPWQVTHDHAAGVSSVQRSGDLLDVVVAQGERGCTVKAAATGVYSSDTPTAAQIEKTRRRLASLVASGALVAVETPGQPTVWRRAPLSLVSPSRETSRS